MIINFIKLENMKRIFLSLFTALITILGLSAQNTYNMVIEMNDGTKINIGPNDIKNMSFMDGNLTVSGESIDDIKKEIAELKKMVDEQKSCECSNEIAALKQEIANLNTSDIIAMINVLQMQIKSLTDEVAALKANGGNNDSQGGGNDDQGGNSQNENNDFSIIGTWNQYESDKEGIDGIWVFNSDKTGTLEEFYKGESEGVEKFTYEYNATQSQLTIYFEEEPNDPSVMKITIVSPTEFTYSEGRDTLTWKKQ